MMAERSNGQEIGRRDVMVPVVTRDRRGRESRHVGCMLLLLLLALMGALVLMLKLGWAGGYVPVRGNVLLPSTKHSAVRFVTYLSSGWEEEWRQHIRMFQPDPCRYLLDSAALSDAFLHSVESTKKDTYRRHETPGSLFRPQEILSHFVYDIGSMKVKVVIEPLIGFFRHPYALCVPPGRLKVSVLNVSHIIFRGMPLDLFRIMYPGRIYLFDLGINGPNRSLAWFDRVYRENGIEFDEIWGWDVRQFQPHDFWRHVPETIYSKLHLMNVRVSEDFTHESHPFQIIKRIFQKGDYIALKLDIDSPGYEQLLADEFLADEDLHGKVADFYYEKHFGAPGFPNHRLPPYGSPHNMVSVIEFFYALRIKGIRAHYWV